MESRIVTAKPPQVTCDTELGGQCLAVGASESPLSLGMSLLVIGKSLFEAPHAAKINSDVVTKVERAEMTGAEDAIVGREQSKIMTEGVVVSSDRKSTRLNSSHLGIS